MYVLFGWNEWTIVEILGWPARVIVLARTLLMKSCRSHVNREYQLIARELTAGRLSSYMFDVIPRLRAEMGQFYAEHRHRAWRLSLEKAATNLPKVGSCEPQNEGPA